MIWLIVFSLALPAGGEMRVAVAQVFKSKSACEMDRRHRAFPAGARTPVCTQISREKLDE